MYVSRRFLFLKGVCAGCRSLGEKNLHREKEFYGPNFDCGR